MVAVIEFAVIIILDDPGVGGTGGFKQGKAALQAHGHAEGLLVQWGREGEPEVGRPPQPFGYHQALIVYRQRDHLSACRQQCVVGPDCARILEPDLVPPVQQHRADDVEGVLGAVGDEDLPVLAIDPLIGPQMRGDGAAKRRETGGVAIAENHVALLAPVLVGLPGPLRDRKHIHGGQGCRKRPDGVRQAFHEFGADGRRGRKAVVGLSRQRAVRGFGKGILFLIAYPDRLTDIGAGSCAAFQKAFGGQALEDIDHRGA